MPLEDELGAAARAAQAFAAPGEELAGVLAAEPADGIRVYLCAYRNGESLSWLALDPAGRPVADRALVREAVAITGLCELAEESAGGGDLADLRARLAELRLTENPEGIEEAEAAAAELAKTIPLPPRLASVEYLDVLGGAATKLERALGEAGASPFAEAMRTGTGAVEELAHDVERNYKRPLGSGERGD
jgi:hypothetical protein